MNKLPAITYLVATVDENRRNLSFDDRGDLLIVKTILIALKAAMPEIRSLLLVNSPAQQSGSVDMGEAPCSAAPLAEPPPNLFPMPPPDFNSKPDVAGLALATAGHALSMARRAATKKSARNKKATP